MAKLQLSRFVVFILLIVNVINMWVIWSSTISDSSDSDMFSFNASDFPDIFPLEVSRSVQVKLNSSDHLPLMGLKSDAAWLALTINGGGYAQLGPSSRVFGASMFHELHCLRVLNLAFGLHPLAPREHVQHCLGYLRSTTLCAADTTVEFGDFAIQQTGFGDEDSEYTCADTDAIYRWMAANSMHHWFE